MNYLLDNIIELKQIAGLHVPGSCLFGLDLGSKTIGIAKSDTSISVANALMTIRRKKFTQDAESLLDEIEKHKAFCLIMGWPLNMDGSQGPRAQATLAFIRNMSRKTNIPFVLWDERLSTVAAERAMLEADMSRKKRAEKIDATAAAFILQGALDWLASHQNS